MRNALDRRGMMIAETSAWLTWALDRNLQVPRIPTRKVRDGGFGVISRMPGAHVVFTRWWLGALRWLEQD